MGGMSIWHILIVLLIVLLLFGPSKLPNLGKSLGEAIRGFKKGISEDPEIDVTASAKREQIQDSDSPNASHAEKKKETSKS